MRTFKVACIIAGLSAVSGLVGQAEAAPLAANKAHDTSTLVSHRPTSTDQFETAAAVVPTRACDSIFCPGYALIGVGF